MGWRVVTMSPRVIDLSNLQTFTAINLTSDPGDAGGPVIVPNAAQISIVWALGDAKLAHNVLYGRYSGGFAGTIAQCNAIQTALQTSAAWTALAAFFATDTTLAGITIRDVNSPNQPVIQSNIAGQPGTSASPALPNETAAVITLRTAQTGRAFRGRVYVPGWATNALGAGNVIAAGAVTALQNWANTLPTALSGSGYTFVLGQKHRVAYTGSTGTAHPDRPANTVPITQQVVRDNHWDSQRRRGLK